MAFVSTCSKSYRRVAQDKLSGVCTKVLDGYYADNTVYPIKVIPKTDFNAAKKRYLSALVAYQSGGIGQKAEYVDSKNAVNEMLDKIGVEVDKIAMGDTGVIVAAGYVPTKQRGPKHPVPPQPESLTVKTTTTAGKMRTQTKVVNKFGKLQYHCICILGNALKDSALLMQNGQLRIDPSIAALVVCIDTGASRKKVFADLEGGMTYTFYYYLVNTTGVGPLSEGVSMKAWG